MLLVRVCELIEAAGEAGSEVGVAPAAPANRTPPPYGRPQATIRWLEGWPCRKKESNVGSAR